MRKLYNEFFYVPKHAKIREKVMLTRVAMIITIIVVCLAVMSITAFAYFSYDVTSGSNIIKAANFETNVSITIEPIDNTQDGSVDVITSNYKSHLTTLNADTTYKITLKPTERSTAKTGFVIVTAENCDSRYHTQQLGKDGDATTEAITFYIKVNAPTEVTFLAHWGTSSYYNRYRGKGDHEELYITQGETVELSINGAVDTKTQITQITTTTDSTTSIETSAVSTTENTTTSSAATTQPTETTTPETTGTSEPISTTGVSPSVVELTVTQPTSTTATEITDTESTAKT